MYQPKKLKISPPKLLYALFPTSVKHLTLNYYIPTYSPTLDQCLELFPSVTYLRLRGTFNQPVDNLPSTLTHLVFGEEFCQPVQRLPSSITHIEFGSRFNMTIDHLPRGLKFLYFYWGNFNQPVNNLPLSLQFLALQGKFDQTVVNYLLLYDISQY